MISNFLLKNCENIDINIRDCEDKTALHVTCKQGNIEILKILIQANINIKYTDIFGKTALHYAFESENVELLNLLITQSNTFGTENLFNNTINNISLNPINLV